MLATHGEGGVPPLTVEIIQAFDLPKVKIDGQATGKGEKIDPYQAYHQHKHHGGVDAPVYLCTP